MWPQDGRGAGRWSVYKGGMWHGRRAILRALRRRGRWRHREIAFFELRREALQGALGISLYTSADGQLQRRHLREEDDHVAVVAKSPRDLLEAMTTGVPSTVYLDAERIAGSVFKAMLEEDLGFPLRQPRIVRLDEPDLH